MEGLPLVSDMHHVAFIYVELHLPFRFPTAKCVDIILQYCSVVFIFDFSVEDAVVCEETHLGFNSLEKIADIQNKQQGGQDSAPGGLQIVPKLMMKKHHPRKTFCQKVQNINYQGDT